MTVPFPMIRALLVVAAIGGVAAAEVPAHVKPFLSGSEDEVWTATVDDVTVVVWWDIMGRGAYKGFGLVVDAKAKGGYRKLALPKLPSGVNEGAMETGLVANLDKDPANELAIALRVTKSGGTYTYSAWKYLILDYTGVKIVRAGAAERKIAQAMAKRETGASELLGEAELRKVLGIASK